MRQPRLDGGLTPCRFRVPWRFNYVIMMVEGDMYKVMSLLSWIWQLPQNIIGCLITSLMCYEVFPGAYGWCNSSSTGSVSLGSYVILGSGRDINTYRHESGHQKQSQLLGPLYLLVIGLPSLCWAGLWCNLKMVRHFTESNISYYDFYTERWADKLGGVTRNER